MEERTFDPRRYVRRLRNGDYLEVRYRLLWFRTEHPDGVVETTLVEHEPGRRAVFRAEVRVPGSGSATGWGSETADEFPDYLEKAETKALGRALAALGFGTQFATEFTEGVDEQGNGGLADAPVESPVEPPAALPAPPAPVRPDGDGVTERQLRALYALGRRHGVPIDDLARARYGVPAPELSRRQASELIEALNGAERLVASGSEALEFLSDLTTRFAVRVQQCEELLRAQRGFTAWDRLRWADLLYCEAMAPTLESE